MRLKKLSFVLIALCAMTCDHSGEEISLPEHQLHFSNLPTLWDEAVPLGNGMLGALIWERGRKLRFSLDRADLWDSRPTEFSGTPEFRYKWIFEQWKNDNYEEVQERFDKPYNELPAPTKIPAGALEFDIGSMGKVSSVDLRLGKAVCEVTWENGAKLTTFVHADKPAGWYRFENVAPGLKPQLIAPAYTREDRTNSDLGSVAVQDLVALGYPQGVVTEGERQIDYVQDGWGGFKYRISTKWDHAKGSLEGVWTISSHGPDMEEMQPAGQLVQEQFSSGGFADNLGSHGAWWKDFWSASSISIPDLLLEKQWYLEQYKFGSATRKDAPPISLQAVWTADNGQIPPWKGDFHHDLNTQLSYWPAYSGNHLELEEGFINWMWNRRDEFYDYTNKFFEAEGLNVPGVTTLSGKALGGWVQYSYGPTVGAWLGHHFYLHWRYTMDRDFLREKAYPWLKETAVFLEDISTRDAAGIRGLPISSSPEIYNNSREAWFADVTNYDLALIRWTYGKAAELARELGLLEEAERWELILSEWPDFNVDVSSGLTFAPGHLYQSHRHFSHQMAYHPLGLIDISKGEDDRKVIETTLGTLDKEGTKSWVGYSFSWLAGLKARALDGKGAAETLRIFATAFCSPNSFHINGDQSGKGYSNLKYRPFTLEGNFAFASSLQEMLIQSHTGVIRILPAIPENWKDVSFERLRTEGAFLVSVSKEDGVLKEVNIRSERGGELRLFDPFGDSDFQSSKAYKVEDGMIAISTEKRETITLSRK